MSPVARAVRSLLVGLIAAPLRAAGYKLVKAGEDDPSIGLVVLGRYEPTQPGNVPTRPRSGHWLEHDGHRRPRIIGHCEDATP